MANENEERRQKINQSGEVLPGDAQRAADEEKEDFDALDSYVSEAVEDNKSDASGRKAVNQSDDVLPGDAKRAADDEKVDSGQ